MAMTVKRIGLWRSEVANEPGALARTLEPLAASRASVRVVMGYCSHLIRPADTPHRQRGCLREDRRALRAEGIPTFVIAQVVGRRFSAVIGFADAAAADSATRLVKAACKAPPAPRRKAARRR